jgi:hypothetical protein
MHSLSVFFLVFGSDLEAVASGTLRLNIDSGKNIKMRTQTIYFLKQSFQFKFFPASNDIWKVLRVLLKVETLHNLQKYIA